MPYKTILVHVDHSRHTKERVRLAAKLAAREDAHLVGASMTGISRFMYEDTDVDLTRTVLANHVDALHQHAEKALAEFERIAASTGVHSVEKRLINDDDYGGLCLQGRYADLVVLSQTDTDDPDAPMHADLPEYVVLNSGRPVLIVPRVGAFETIGDNMLVAWDASMEATRAITNAIPLMRRAKKVVVALFDPSSSVDGHGEQPGADIALYLARHGINVEVSSQVTAGQIDVGNALLSLAADSHSDLIVMGGYGHSRFREILMGGATKTLLESMTVPVLMSH